MIEVTCGACGSTHRFAEADVPPGGKTVTCAKCKARITVPAARAMPSIPSPASGGGTGDVINLSDLPAPKRPSPLAGAKPMGPPPIGGKIPPLPRAKLPAIAPLPAKAPAPPAPPVELDMDAIDLPAPVGPEPTGGLDLLAPVGPSPRGGLENLPAPKRASGPGRDEISIDLPAPKRPSGPADVSVDLPAPKRASAATGPAPAPALGDASIDLPAPKGFFDDLPAPVGAEPRGGLLDLPTPKLDPSGSSTGSIDLPAPKGFFDDLPAPAGPTSRSADLPAPKGFFDDLPGPRAATPTRPPAPAPVDLSPPSQPPRGKGLDLDDLDLAPPTQPPQRPQAAPPAGIAAAAPPRAMPLELDPQDDVPALELDGPADRFGGLDLPAGPTSRPGPAAGGGVVAFKASSADPAVITAPRDPGALDLDLDDAHKPRPSVARTSAELPRERTTGAGAKATAKAGKGRLRTILLAAALVVAGGGAGAFFLYTRYQDRQQAAEQRDASLKEARRLLAADSPRHWAQAAAAAETVLATAPKHAEALALAAQAYLAGYLDEGTDKKRRLSRAAELIDLLRGAAATGTPAEKALGLAGIVSGDPVGAIEKLTAVAARSETDVDARLFLGWAHAAAGDRKAAIAAFEQAADSKTRAVSATYALGLAHLELGDLEAARRSFSLVNEMTKKGDHIGAQIGIAAAMPETDYARRETELLAVLGRKDIAKADPRAVARGWTLAGDDARRAGRLDAARDRYRKALEVDADHVAAIVGDAEIALAEGRLDAAAAGLAQAVKLDETDVDANLALAELEIRQGQLPEAEARLTRTLAAASHPTDRARAHLLEARRREAAGQPAAALESYAAAQEAAGPADIAPTVAQATLLGKMAAAAQAGGDAGKASAHRDAARKLLGALEDKARQDPPTALTLGRAYLAAGDGANAEKWLAVAQRSRKEDLEIIFQLAEALELQGKHDAAVDKLAEAFALDPARVDVGLELARTYESAGRRDEAAEMYRRLLASPAVTLDMRVRAGLFYARTGDARAAAAQGDEIAKVEPDNAAGMYLRAEGLYVDGKFEEARKLYKDASEAEAQAIYFDGFGRAAEQTGIALDEGRYKDEALVAYTRAAELDPELLSSQLGRARIHLDRREWEKAIGAYETARGIDPRQAEIALGLGLAYQGKGDKPKAIQWLSQAVKLTPTAEAHFLLGRMHLEDNDARPASVHYAAATRLALDDERAGKPAPRWLTDALWQLGQLQEPFSEPAACAAYDKYLSRNPVDDVKVRETKSKLLALRCRR